jgi:hypothetical protein
MSTDQHSPIASLAGQDCSRLGSFLESRFRQRYEVEAVSHVIAFVDEASSGFDGGPALDQSYSFNVDLWNQDYLEYLSVRNDTCVIVMGAQANRLWVGVPFAARPSPNSLVPAGRVGAFDPTEIVVQQHLFLPHFESSLLGRYLTMDRGYINTWGLGGAFSQVVSSSGAEFKTSPLITIRAPVFFYRDNSGSFKTEHSELMASQLKEHFGENNYTEYIDTSERWLKPCNDFLKNLFKVS